MRLNNPVALLLLISTLGSTTHATASSPPVPGDLAARFARLALDCIHREYPNKIAHVLNDAEDAQPPSSLYPVFHGCFDWHSSVHGHWPASFAT